jgi:alpha-L-fucosidase 2
MQYENGKIKLLPALPKSLSSGSVSGIIAKGNVKIDMAWESGAITSLVLSSPSAQGVTVVCGNEREISVTLTENTPKKII